jgi:hypothetical protein
MTMHKDVKMLQKSITQKVQKAAAPRQAHFDKVARELGYADSNIAFKEMGKAFIEIASANAPSIKIQ